MKTVETIYEEMLEQFGERTGLEPVEGCDLSARLYAVADEGGAFLDFEIRGERV